jgi:hypothetical protein
LSVAAVRPDSWNLPLLLHVAGAMVLVGALVTVLAALVAARRGGDAALTRLGFRTLLIVGVPAFLLMRVGAEWVASEEDVPDDATWIGIGYMVSDLGLLLMIVATVLAGLGARRAAREGERGRSTVVATALVAVMVVAYLAAVWAMTAKPG